MVKVKYLNKTRVEWNKLEGDKLMVVDVSAVMRTNQVYLNTPNNIIAGLYNPNARYQKKELYTIIDDEYFNTSAMYGLLRIFKLFNLTSNVIFCFDSVKNLRKDIDKNYKGNRVRQGNEYYDQVNSVYKMLESVGYNVCLREGYESDDLIDYVVKYNKEDYDHIGILTNDKDLTHLVDDNVYWLNCLRTKGDIHKGNYEDMLGIPYNTITLYKALVGDSSDNFKGVKGFGKVSYKKLIENELKNYNLAEIRGNEEKVIYNLTTLNAEQKKEAFRCLKLAQPLEYKGKLECSENEDIDWGKMKVFLGMFEMKSIIEYIDSLN